ncbi:unnamed protein product [Clonostachys rosea]|uniref:Secretory phospholipase A2 n=1 Tax=Bionectria ochroleuca TaxID=29856 RepID=A0ABY6UVN2_BIOOC|nr:unnamed protein product [Clonostachys rosea]
MKFAAVLLPLISAVVALPTGEITDMEVRATEAVVDEIMFSITLPAFTTRRNAKNPSDVDWSSDGCTSSPDNPLGFKYEPACNRHDFGYQNFRLQSRFTKANKAKIDSNFLADLQYQCKSETFTSLCNALAQVYYAAVRAFGGDDATKRSEETEDLVAIYEEKLAIWNQMYEEAKQNGEIPA